METYLVWAYACILLLPSSVQQWDFSLYLSLLELANWEKGTHWTQIYIVFMFKKSGGFIKNNNKIISKWLQLDIKSPWPLVIGPMFVIILSAINGNMLDVSIFHSLQDNLARHVNHENISLLSSSMKLGTAGNSVRMSQLSEVFINGSLFCFTCWICVWLEMRSVQ